MAKVDVWPTIHAERKLLAADMEGLTEAQWARPSPCDAWTVRDVLAHLTATAKIAGPQFFVKIAGAGFSLTKMQDKDIAVERGATPADTLAGFKAQMDSRKHPPGPPLTMLGEMIVHAEDIRRALDIPHDYPSAAVTEVADFYKNSNLVMGAKKRVAGLTLRATDTDWVHGSGPEVSGPMLAIVLAMTGRKGALDDLTGEGVATLRSRG